jgi:hypothetical protein
MLAVVAVLLLGVGAILTARGGTMEKRMATPSCADVGGLRPIQHVGRNSDAYCVSLPRAVD